MFNGDWSRVVTAWNETSNPYIACIIDHYANFMKERPKNRKMRALKLKIKKFCEENPDVIPLLASEACNDVAYYIDKLEPDHKVRIGREASVASMYHCGRYTEDHVLVCLQQLFHDLATPITYFGSSTLRPPSFGKARPTPKSTVMNQTETSGAILALKPKFLGDIHPVEEFKRVAESLRVNHKGYALKFFADNAPALLDEAMKWKIPQDPDDVEPVVFDSTPVLATK